MSEINTLRLALIAVTMTTYVIAIGAAGLTGMKVLYSEWFWLGLYCMVGFGPLIAFTSRRGLNRFRTLGETMLGGLLLTAPVVGVTYAAISAAFPYADEHLMAMDAALGFDWHGLIMFVDSRPWLEEALWWSYQSFSFQLLLLPPALSLAGHLSKAYGMVIGYALICLLASLVSIWYPALGTYTVYQADQLDLKNINPHFAYYFLAELQAVRTDPEFVLSLKHFAGILTFPSVHAATAVLCAWAAWSFRYARWPLLLLNVMMSVAAITHSNHYLVDIIAGVATAAVCILFITLYVRFSASKTMDARTPEPGPATGLAAG